MITTRESPGKWTQTSDLSHGAATTEPLETSTSRRRPPFSLFTASRSRHPDNPFDLSLSNHHPFSSLVLAPRFSLSWLLSLWYLPRPSLFLNPTCQCCLLFLLHSYYTETLFALKRACVRACVYTYLTLNLSRHFLRRSLHHRLHETTLENDQLIN